MDELEYLRTMWTPTSRRKSTLMIEITSDGMDNAFDNASWAFNVPYAFRDALDIKYEQRTTKKETQMIWTQGPLLGFKGGDLINSNDGARAVQVESGIPMQWNSVVNEENEEVKELNKGKVVYVEYSVSNGRYTKLDRRTCTQMQFLELLIHGRYQEQQ